MNTVDRVKVTSWYVVRTITGSKTVDPHSRMPTFRPLLLADARAPLEASVEELSQVKGFEQTIVEAANALMILHSILGEPEVRALSTHLQDPRSN
jgi:hypothetical protein